MPLPHTVELNAGTVDTAEGPQLQAGLDVGGLRPRREPGRPVGSTVVRGAGRNLCARARRRGRAHPVGHRARAAAAISRSTSWSAGTRIADILPLTPLQRGLLFHTGTARMTGMSADMYSVQLDFTLTGTLDPDRLRASVQAVSSTGIRTWPPSSIQDYERARADPLRDPEISLEIPGPQRRRRPR